MKKILDTFSTDHDNIIRIETKLDNLTDEVKLLRDGLASRVATLEQRVASIDELHAKVDPITSTKKVNDLEIKFHDFETTATIYRTMAGFIGGAIFFILSQVPAWFKLFFK